MNICFTASRLMKTKEVREFCQQVRENKLRLMVMERRAKQKLREIQQIQQEKRPAQQQCGFHGQQMKHWGIDALGDEIFEDDVILEFPNGDIVLAENIYEYAMRVFDAKELVAK